jgi:glycosyltransferase involved in cell wall biosynthesis
MDFIHLEINNYFYNRIIFDFFKSCHFHPETSLASIQLIAEFAHAHHPGRFADGAIENRALEIGADLERHRRNVAPLDIDLAGSEIRQTAARMILHIATAVKAIGGHTRTIQNWVKNDPTSSHSLLLIDQKDLRIPEWLIDPIRASGGLLIRLPAEAPLMAKALWVREISRSRADLVVLHHTAFDIVPTVAFAIEDCPPVAILNHADHIFWLGSSVADIIINLRSIGSRLSELRRFVRHNTTLPIPLSQPDETISRKLARERLGIPPDRIVLLSIGRAEKYQPSATHDFFATTRKILEHHPEAHLYIIGVSEAEAVWNQLGPTHPRAHPMGVVEDPSAYRAAADIYLEGFPFGSQTALLESSLAGIPPVTAFAPPLELVVTNDDAIADLITNPRDEDEYIDRVSELVGDTEKRRSLGSALRDRMLAHHTGEGWQRRLHDVYAEACGLKHEPRPIPRSQYVASETDRALSAWQASTPGGGSSESELTVAIRQSFFELAYHARQARNYRAAFGLLLRCCCRWGGDRKIFWSLAKLLPHWVLKSHR